MKTTLKEIANDTFFIHNYKIKYKKEEINNQFWIAPITINLNEDSILHFLNNSNSLKLIKENQEISLLNKENWELFLFESESAWFLLDPKNFEILNFSGLSYQQSNILKKKLNLYPKTKNKYCFQGKVFLTIKEGKLNFDSIIFEENDSQETETEKINYLLYKELNDQKNLNKKKNNIFNNLFINNSLFSYITHVKKDLSLETKSSGFDCDLWKSLNILTFCIIESDFYSALITIRSIRNLIFSLIYEKQFIPKYSKLKYLVKDLKWREDIVEWEKNDKIYVEKENQQIYLNEIKNIKKEIQLIIKWIKRYDSSAKPQTLEQMIKEVDFYHLQPLYYAKETFDSLKSNLENQKHISNAKVFTYIEQELLEDETDKKNWKIANYLTNNTVHKTNYDTERSENWYLNKNELNILKETLSIYVKILKNFKKDKND